MRSPCMFYLKEFWFHYKFTPLACFLVKYRGHECIMIIGLFPRPVVCGWCGYPVITVVGLDPGCPGGPLSASDPGGPLAPSCPVWPGAWWSRQAMCPGSSWVSLSHWVALLRGWLVSLDVMCFGGHHFLIIYNTVWIHPELESFGIVQVNLRNPGILHLKAFVLYLAPFLLCYFGRIIFLEYDSGLWAIAHYHIWGSATVSELFQDYKNARTPCFGGFHG